MDFKTLGLPDTITKGLKDLMYNSPTPVQEKAIPLILDKKDVLVLAPTGTGKTGSYLLPLLAKIEKLDILPNRCIRSLILVPTRELALQVHENCKIYSSQLSRHIKSKAVYGGVSINPQMKGLINVEVLIATPGRLLDLVDKNAISINMTSFFVMDEADKLLNLGFQDELKKILSFLPSSRQNVLVSATLDKNVDAYKSLILNNPVVVSIEEKKDEEVNIDQSAYLVSAEKKGPLLRYILKNNKYGQVMIFTSSVDRCVKVTNKLTKNNIAARCFHSKMSQGARKKALDEFSDKRTKILVTTDLLSRGIDITDLPVVLNYELPRSPKDFIHRIGRTARAGKTGIVISLVTPDDLHHFKVIQKKMKTYSSLIDAEELDFKGL